MPAPAFTVRDIVNIFVARAEIMPAEESAATHQQRREEERDIVEKDRGSAHGLFKGTFTGRHIQRIIFDEADRIHRCGACGHEFRPGPTCSYCGTDFEGEEEQLADDHWSDDADDDEDDVDGIDVELDDIEYDIDDHLAGEDMSQMGYDSDGEELDWEGGLPHMMGGAIPLHHAHLVAAELRHHLRLHRGHHHFYHGDGEADHDGEGSSDEEDSDGDSAGSLNEFIDHDEDNQDMAGSTPVRRVNRRNRHSIVAISSDDEQEQEGEEEDEDDRPIRSRFRSHNSRSRPMVIDEDDDDEDDDHDEDHVRGLPSRSRRIRPQLETDDSGSEANNNSGVSLNRLRGGRPSISDSDSEAEPAQELERNVDMEAFGWSPLANGPESGDEESHELNGYDGYESEQSGDGSDHTLRVEDDNDGSVQSVQWDDEGNPYDQEELALASWHGSRGMPHVPNPPRRRRRPWEQESPPARTNRRQHGGAQMGSAQREISLESEGEENSSSEDEAEDDEEIQGGQDVEMSEVSESPPRTAETAESEDEEVLGQAHVAHVDADQSSEDSMQPPRRRRRLRSLRQEQHEENDYDYFGFGSQVFNSPPRHSRVPRTSRISRPGQYYESRRAEPVSPAFRSPRRAQYAFTLPAMESPRASRRPRGYEYNSDSYSRSRPHDSYY